MKTKTGTKRVKVGSIDCTPELDPYSGNGSESRATLRINPASRSCHVYQDYPGNNSTPIAIYNGLVIEISYGDCGAEGEEYPINAVDEGGCNSPMESCCRDFLKGAEGQKLLARIIDGHEEYNDGSNIRGRLDADAKAALEEMKQAFNDVRQCSTTIWDAADYLAFSDPASAFGITAATTNAELAVIAEKAEHEALNNHVILNGAEGFLTQIRDELLRNE